jgi:electron transport complex protein RnfG
MGEMIKMVVVLTVLSLLSGGGLAKLHDITGPFKENNIMTFDKGPAIRTMLSKAENDPVQDRFKIQDGEIERNVFVGVFDGKANTVVLESAASGYGDKVGVVVGINIDDQAIAGVAVTTHKETPGLGGEAKDDPAWAAQFVGKPIDKPVSVTNDGGEISALSGATITSRAVCKAASQALEAYGNLKPRILEKLEGIKK